METETVFQDRNNSVWGTNNVLEDTINSLVGTELASQDILMCLESTSLLGSNEVVFRRTIVSSVLGANTFSDDSTAFKLKLFVVRIIHKLNKRLRFRELNCLFKRELLVSKLLLVQKRPKMRLRLLILIHAII